MEVGGKNRRNKEKGERTKVGGISTVGGPRITSFKVGGKKEEDQGERTKVKGTRKKAKGKRLKEKGLGTEVGGKK